MNKRRHQRDINGVTAGGVVVRCCLACKQWLPCNTDYFSCRVGRTKNPEWRVRCRACEQQYEKTRKALKSATRGALAEELLPLPAEGYPPALSWRVLLGL